MKKKICLNKTNFSKIYDLTMRVTEISDEEFDALIELLDSLNQKIYYSDLEDYVRKGWLVENV